jgi:hypothetical protein
VPLLQREVGALRAVLALELERPDFTPRSQSCRCRRFAACTPDCAQRLCAFPLAVDMIVALSTVGVPNLLGHPVLMEGIAVTTQPWRLPLEVVQLLLTLLFLWQPLSSPAGLAPRTRGT